MWFTNNPTEPGYYWLYIYGEMAEPRVVEVNEWLPTFGITYNFTGGDSYPSINDVKNGLWMKIGRPKLPKGKHVKSV